MEIGKKVQIRNRISFLDCSRALCMLWIIGIWHMAGYMQINVSNTVTTNVTNGVFAAFTFISGFFLGKKQITKKKDILDFYKKRLLRFYPLFFLSCLSLYIMYILWDVGYIQGFKQFVLTILGLSCIITPAPQTIWFVSMLILFYAVTPLIIGRAQIKWRLLMCSIFYLILLIINLINPIDNRILICFPFYCAGLVSANLDFLQEELNLKIFIASSCFFFGLSIFLSDTSNLVIIVLSTLFVIMILGLGKACTRFYWIKKGLEIIGYSSMCAYLFHRQILGCISKIIEPTPIWMAYIIIMPVVILMSYMLQKIYDKTLNQITNK